MPQAAGQPCPCGRTDARGRPFLLAQCCGPLLESDEAARDAEALMRSRYSAFVLGDERYLLATWHASTRPAEARAEPATRWLGLQVRDVRVLDETHAEVEFVARYRVGGRGARLHERSRFVREEGRWYYVDGSS